jgi:spoIIIJ-associated protein
MRSVEASGKTRKEAIEKALEELGVELHQVNIDILDEGSKGIFGLLSRDVKVKVSTEVPGARPRRREETQTRAPREQRPPARSPRDERAPRPARDDRAARPAREERGPRPPREERAPRPPRPVPTEPRAEARPAVKKDFDSAESQEHAREAAALLAEIIKRMGIEAAVEAQPTEEGFKLQVESPDSAILIGRKGRNLSSMQYLLNRMVHTDEADFTERIIIDVEDYLDRRQATLEELAQRMAEKAKESGRDIRLKPLSPQERRIVHVTLEGDPEVRTFSLGDSVYRTMVISPKRGDGEAPRRSRRGGRRSGGRGRRRPESGETSTDTSDNVSGDTSAQDAV